jgi:hypothetical protein
MDATSKDFAMISRWFLFALGAVILASGCCCQDMCGGGCGPAGCGSGGRGSLFCRTYEQRMADSTAYECGTCCKTVGCGGGIKGWLRNQATGCKGCGDIYYGEWISDPPDCCDPCHKCGGFSGSGGTCCKPDCLARLSRMFSSYRYCGNDCGGSCGMPQIFGCRLCGGAGCDSCGGGQGEEYVEPRAGHDTHHPRGSVLDENWDPAPTPKPTPGKPIHKANTPKSIKVGSGRMPGGETAAQQASYEPWR